MVQVCPAGSGSRRLGASPIGRGVAASAAVAVALFCAQATQADIYSGVGGVFSDSAGEGSPGVVSFLVTIEDVGSVDTFNSLSLLGLNHTFLGDLGATITAPDGTVVTLFERIGKTSPDSGFGDSSNFFGNYVFADGGANIWTAAASVPGSGVVAPGTYSASAALTGAAINLQSAFAGKSIFGTWTLTISDYAAGEVGLITGWNINMNVVPGPSALAFGAIGLAGRAFGRTRSRRAR